MGLSVPLFLALSLPCCLLLGLCLFLMPHHVVLQQSHFLGRLLQPSIEEPSGGPSTEGGISNSTAAICGQRQQHCKEKLSSSRSFSEFRETMPFWKSSPSPEALYTNHGDPHFAYSASSRWKKGPQPPHFGVPFCRHPLSGTASKRASFGGPRECCCVLCRGNPL